MMRLTRWLGAAMALMLCLSVLGSAQEPSDSVTVPFSDPGRIGTVDVRVLTGGITIRARDRRDVSVSVQPGAARGRQRTDTDADASGLRRLTSPTGLVVEEENNEMSVRTGAFGKRANLEVLVPARVNLKLSTLNGGDVLVEGVQGEIEVNNLNGSIVLNGVAGAVVAHSTNGKVVATVRQVTAGAPMAFTSLNGTVDVTLPADVKANLKLRTDHGDVYSDFDVAIRQSQSPSVQDSRRNGRYRIELDKAIYGSVNGGGPEFELRTFNGNVYVRKGGQ